MRCIDSRTMKGGFKSVLLRLQTDRCSTGIIQLRYLRGSLKTLYTIENKFGSWNKSLLSVEDQGQVKVRGQFMWLQVNFGGPQNTCTPLSRGVLPLETAQP